MIGIELALLVGLVVGVGEQAFNDCIAVGRALPRVGGLFLGRHQRFVKRRDVPIPAVEREQRDADRDALCGERVHAAALSVPAYFR
ncbi:hypothetical protein [Paraburkholderia bryophila]|uniref:hypothetical protein n=1 Tax=Paraburkholderia bryophila TaxID=420952 RepID=UPI003CC5B2D8